MNLESFEVGFNIPAKVGMDISEIQTPSLIIDYKIFESNISRIAIRTGSESRGRRFSQVLYLWEVLGE